MKRGIIMKTVVQLLLVIALFTFASTASAYTIDSGATEVGEFDQLVIAAAGTSNPDDLANSGDDFEIAWVNDVLGLLGDDRYTAADFVKYNSEDDDDSNDDVENAWDAVWSPVDDELDANGNPILRYGYAFDFGTDVPDYFLVKIGDGGMDYSHYLYSNDDNYGVVSLLNFIDDTTKTIDFARISHLDTFGAAPVPEPSTLLLLGAGIAGLAVYRRKKS